MRGASTNSTAIDRVPGTRSKSDEKCEAPLLLLEISSTSCEIERRLCCTLWDPESTVDLRTEERGVRSAAAVRARPRGRGACRVVDKNEVRA